jgi:hypothetical protein
MSTPSTREPLIIRQDECDEVLGVFGGALKDVLRK